MGSLHFPPIRGNCIFLSTETINLFLGWKQNIYGKKEKEMA